MGKERNVPTTDGGDGPGDSQARKKKDKKATGISGMWAVPVVYGVVAGMEGLLAGSVVGLV